MSLFVFNHQYLVLFSYSSMSPAFPALLASSCSLSPALSLLWMHHSEQEVNIMSRQVMFLAVMFRNGLLTISDLNGNDCYIKEHWLVSLLLYTVLLSSDCYSFSRCTQLTLLSFFLSLPKTTEWMSGATFLLLMTTLWMKADCNDH